MIRIGVICPSEIAYRRFMPAIMKCAQEEIKYMGVAVANEQEWFGEKVPQNASQILDGEREKAQKFVDEFGGRIYDGYDALLQSEEIDAVYLPLPPALHYKWAKRALECGKHVYLEKPFTPSLKEAEELISLAKEKNLALHENYMFVFHKQIEEIKEEVKKGSIGDVRLYRISFGFPRRAVETDFRYHKALGGGTILDNGGYTFKLAALFLGEDAKVTQGCLNYTEEFDVDLFGSAVMVGKDGLNAQLAFGMDNDYKCSLEIWGSKGTLFTNRILTAPEGFVPEMNLHTQAGDEKVSLSADDAFYKSINHFADCVKKENVREENYELIRNQAQRVQAFHDLARRKN